MRVEGKEIGILNSVLEIEGPNNTSNGPDVFRLLVSRVGGPL